MKEVLLSCKNISKSFPGVVALNNVSFDVKRGEVLGIIGENGAGKSTLMKILSGIYQPDNGDIFLENNKTIFKNPKDSLNKGISIIFQELNLIDSLSIAENIYLDRLSNSNIWINWNDLTNKANDLLNQIGIKLDSRTKVEEINIAYKQMVEIAKALSYDSKLLIMDEPTGTLTNKEVESLFSTIRDLTKNGVSIIYISHKLDEVFEICDRVTVMRDGNVINTYDVENANRDTIIQDMIGRKIDQEYPQRFNSTISDEVVLEVKDLCRNNVFDDISFTLKKGEVLGFAGLIGSGRTEIMRALFGADKYNSGQIIVKGKKIKIEKPIDAINNGIAFLTEDRKQQGLILNLSVRNNISLANLKEIVKSIFISKEIEKENARNYIETLNIKTPSDNQNALYLSGGNQQKVVLAKWLFTNSDILILDEPTRGIDVGAKLEIYNIINELVSVGKSIILISSDLPELISMSDRVIAISEGRKIKEFVGDEITSENVMSSILNVKRD